MWMDKEGKTLFEHHRYMMARAWARVHRPLRDALPSGIYRQRMTLERVEEGAGSVTAVFADDSREKADLVVAADDVQSTVRKQYLPQVQPRFASYVTWRGFQSAGNSPTPRARSGTRSSSR